MKYLEQIFVRLLQIPGTSTRGNEMEEIPRTLNRFLQIPSDPEDLMSHGYRRMSEIQMIL